MSYLRVRYELTTYLNVRNYSSFYTLKVEETVLELQSRLIKIVARLELIKEYLSETLTKDIDTVIRKIEDPQQSQSNIYLAGLESLTKGVNVDRKKLQKN